MTNNPSGNQKYYTDQEVAVLLGLSLGRLRTKLSAGHPLPPRIQVPTSRHRLWPRSAVHDWLAQYTIESTTSAPGSHRRGKTR